MAISDQGRVAGTNTETFVLDVDDLALIKAAAADYWTQHRPGQDLPEALREPPGGWQPQIFTLHSLEVGIFAKLSSFCLAQRGDILGTVVAAMPSIPTVQQSLWMETAISMASRRDATKRELDDFQNTPLGTAYMIWASLGEEHRLDFPTPESVRDLLFALKVQGNAKEAKLVEIQYKFLVASGMEAIKNSDGQPETP